MLSKAEEATAQAQQLLQKSLEKWLPSWMETRYAKVRLEQLADSQSSNLLWHAAAIRPESGIHDFIS